MRLPSRRTMLETLIRRLSLVRITAVLVVVHALFGCTGLVGDGLFGGDDDGNSEAEARAIELFTTQAAPKLAASCGSCHAGQRPGIDFLAGGEPLAVRTKLLEFTPVVVNLDAPSSSRLLSKGAHDGPAFIPSDLAVVLEWIRAEKDAQPDPGGDGGVIYDTPRIVPALCTAGTPPEPTCPVNALDLTELGLPGAKIEFVAVALSATLYLNQLKLTASTDGAYIEHPLFVSYPPQGAPIADSIDRFNDVKMNLEAAMSEQIAGGTAGFVGFPATNEISVHFKAVKPFQPEDPGNMGGGGAAGGCKVLASFKQNAQQLISQNCGSCHANAGNANATSAMNITTINSTDDLMIQQACNQVRTRANLTTPDQSGIFLAPDPNNGNHPFRFNAGTLNTFRNGPPGTGVLGWINAERTAP